MCKNTNLECCLVTKPCLALATPWTVACQVPLSMGFLRQEYWSGLPFPSPEDLPDPGIEPMSPASSHWQANSLPLSHGDGGKLFYVWLCWLHCCRCCLVSKTGQIARIPERVAISFSRGSSQPRDQTQISCIGRWILYH